MRTIAIAIASIGVLAAALLVAPEASACGNCAQHASSGKASAAPRAFDKPPAVGTLATCPVTGEQFKVTASTTRSEYKGKHYVFCCPGCKPKFDRDPAKYIN